MGEHAVEFAHDALSEAAGTLPRGKTTEILSHGHDSAGGTTLCLSAARGVLESGGVSVYVDLKLHVSPTWAEKMGVGLGGDSLLWYTPRDWAEVVSMAGALEEAGVIPDLFVVDGVVFAGDRRPKPAGSSGWDAVRGLADELPDRTALVGTMSHRASARPPFSEHVDRRIYLEVADVDYVEDPNDPFIGPEPAGTMIASRVSTEAGLQREGVFYVVRENADILRGRPSG